jgi:hypothetical protein
MNPTEINKYNKFLSKLEQKKIKKIEEFVINSEKVSSIISTSHKIWLKLPGFKGKKHNDNPMRALHRDYNFFTKTDNFKKYLNKDEIKFINDHQSGWMKKYKDAWYLINK